MSPRGGDAIGQEETLTRSRLKAVLAMAAFAAAGTLTAPALAFPIEVPLTGDPRPGNPDNLIIDVDIVLIDADTVEWTIDIYSPLHPNARLDEFYFNMVTPAGGSYSFSDISPDDWLVTTFNPPSQGGGGIAFNFEALDPSGPPNADDVDNATKLVFRMNLNGGPTFTDSLFLTAGSGCSNDAVLGCGQVGAHLQSLTVPAGLHRRVRQRLRARKLLGTAASAFAARAGYAEPAGRGLPRRGDASPAPAPPLIDREAGPSEERLPRQAFFFPDARQPSARPTHVEQPATPRQPFVAVRYARCLGGLRIGRGHADIQHLHTTRDRTRADPRQVRRAAATRHGRRSTR